MFSLQIKRESVGLIVSFSRTCTDHSKHSFTYSLTLGKFHTDVLTSKTAMPDSDADILFLVVDWSMFDRQISAGGISESCLSFYLQSEIVVDVVKCDDDEDRPH